MNRRTTALQRDDASPGHEVGDSPETVSFGYRGDQFEAELDVEQQRALEAVLERFIARGRVKD